VLAQEKTKGRKRVDAVADCEAPDAFYRAEEGGEMVSWRKNGRGEWSYSMISFRGNERKEQHPFRKGKGACGAAVCSGG
jgi:hypothetical protein